MQGDHDIHKQTETDRTVSKHTNEEDIARKEKRKWMNSEREKKRKKKRKLNLNYFCAIGILQGILVYCNYRQKKKKKKQVQGK